MAPVTIQARWLPPAVLGACAIVPVSVVLAMVPDQSALIGFFPDDAFYYLQPAWNAVRRGSLSFDGTNGMTGFHPLHMLVTLGWMGMVGKDQVLSAMLAWNALCLAVALGLISQTVGLRRREVPWAILLASPPFTLYLFTNAGLECGTLVLMSAVMLRASLRASVQPVWRWRDAIRLGMVMGLWVLARLDMVLPLVVVGSALVYQRRRGEWWRATTGLIVGGILTVGPYVVWLWHVQGTLVPMSAVAKYGRIRWPFARVMTALTGDNLEGWILLGLAPAVAAWVLWRPGRDAHAPMLRVWALAVIGYTTYVMCVAHAPFRWYLVVGTSIGSWLLMARLPSLSLPRAGAGTVIVTLVVHTVVLTGWLRRDTTSRGLLDAAMALNRALPEGTPIATHDAGVLSFYYHGPVHNLDGLANSRDNWQRYLSRGQEVAYAVHYQIPVLVLRRGHATRADFAPVTAAGPVMSIDARRFGFLWVYHMPGSDVHRPPAP
jgi:hypothetical protein